MKKASRIRAMIIMAACLLSQATSAKATTGGPEIATILGWSPTEKKIYYIIHFVDESDRSPAVYFLDLASSQPGRAVPLHLWPEKAPDYRSIDSKIEALRKKLVPLSAPVPDTLGVSIVTQDVQNKWRDAQGDIRSKYAMEILISQESLTGRALVTSFCNREILIKEWYKVPESPFAIVNLSYTGLPVETCYTRSAVVLLTPSVSLGQAPARTPVVTTPHFAFYSDLETNLNDALIAAGLARKGGKPQLFHSGTEVSCFDKLPPSVRAGWDRAVDYYAEIISPADWTDRQQHLLRVQLVGFTEELKDAGDLQFVEIARSFRAAATPAYKVCRWAAQDEKNHRSIEDLKSRLAVDEQRIAARLEQLYQKRWGGLPIPVDIVETVNWSGANSILRDPAGGHLLISTSYQGPAALEIVFHEASHLLMGRGDPLRQALNSAASTVDYRLPGDLWHVVLFYTTGEAVRRILDDREKYTPIVYEIFERGTWDEYRQALESTWKPYLEGKRDLSEAAASLIEVLRRPEQPH